MLDTAIEIMFEVFPPAREFSSASCGIYRLPFPEIFEDGPSLYEDPYRERLNRKIFNRIFSLDDVLALEDDDNLEIVSLAGLPVGMYDTDGIPYFTDHMMASDLIKRKMLYSRGLLLSMISDPHSDEVLAVFHTEENGGHMTKILDNLTTGKFKPKDYKFVDGIFASFDEDRNVAICKAALRAEKLFRKHADEVPVVE